jgi:hypothetical protein
MVSSVTRVSVFGLECILYAAAEKGKLIVNKINHFFILSLLSLKTMQLVYLICIFQLDICMGFSQHATNIYRSVNDLNTSHNSLCREVWTADLIHDQNDIGDLSSW